MERLDFKLPEFSRFIWVSEEAKNVWLSRFQHISVAWELVERFSVISGVRQAALQTVTPDALIPLSNWATSHGLVVVPLARQGVSDGYQNATVEYSEGNPWTYRVVICTPQYARDFVEAWNVGNDNVIGTLLGFPGCCREFYKWSWVEGNWRDVALTSAIGKSAAKSLDFPRLISQVGYYQSNVFLRHLGVRLVSHLPCSPDCEYSVNLAEVLARIALKAGLLTEISWAREALRWPLKWSSLHGVAILTTPVVKIVYNTDALSESVEIRREGEAYPAEGGRGDFPFREIVHVANTSKNNGFTNVESMINAHAMIIHGLLSLEFPPGSKVIDLGCGDGQLLETITGIADIVPVGIESNKSRFQKATKKLSGIPNRLHCLDIFSNDYWEGEYFLGLISIQRLFEADAEKAKELLRRLKTNCKHVVFYSYLSDQWTGYIGLTSNFVLEKFLRSSHACAALMRPMEAEEPV